MKRRKTLVPAVAAMALVCTKLPALADEQTVLPDNKPAAVSTSAAPPGYRLEKTVLCDEEHSPPLLGKPGPIKRHDLHVGILVPQDDCLALDADAGCVWCPASATRCRLQGPARENHEHPSRYGDLASRAPPVAGGRRHRITAGLRYLTAGTVQGLLLRPSRPLPLEGNSNCGLSAS
ncbi:hypothetical protein [Polaromonas sp. YR568]|uniref:hypothetical protein n=1 Tax=Polaromonas sp. YR568 TaxID=1855301 RepID=UPI00398C04E3